MAYRIYPRKRQSGFTLVELMVAGVVGLIVLLAVTASVATIDRQRKTTVSGVDAQESAQIALSEIDRVGRMAGAGLMSGGDLICKSINFYYKGKVVSDGAKSGAFLPVVLTSGGLTGSDSIRFAFSEKPGGLSAVRIVNDMPSPSSVFTVNQAGLLKKDDVAIIGAVGRDAPCTVFQVSKEPEGTGGGACGKIPGIEECENILHNSGDYNPPNPEKEFSDAPRYGYENNAPVVGPSIIMNTGLPVTRQFSVLCSTLVVSNNLGAAPSCTASPLSFANADALAGDIVQMKAQYGVSNDPKSNVVTAWENPMGLWADNVVGDKFGRVKAIRVVVVARAKEPATENVTAECTNAAGVKNVGPCSFQDANAPVIDLSEVPVPAAQTWQRYRYRVYQTVIPLRNLLWNKGE